MDGILLYPAVGTDFNTGSYKTYADGRFLSRDFMEFGYNLYTPNLQTRKEIYALPMAATINQLKGLPRTLIQTVDNDPRRDEGEAYGHKLLEAGVDCSMTRYMNLIHDFQVLNAINNVPGVKQSIRQVCTELKDALK
jgi:acetyl esterase